MYQTLVKNIPVSALKLLLCRKISERYNQGSSKITGKAGRPPAVHHRKNDRKAIIIIINVLIKVTLNEYTAEALYRVGGRR